MHAPDPGHTQCSRAAAPQRPPCTACHPAINAISGTQRQYNTIPYNFHAETKVENHVCATLLTPVMALGSTRFSPRIPATQLMNASAKVPVVSTTSKRISLLRA